MKAEIYSYRVWVKPPVLGQLDISLRHLLRGSSHTVLAEVRHDFGPEAYTVLWLLAESHLALHTWPEHETAYIELSSCSEAKYEQFVQQAGAVLEVQRVVKS